VALTSPPSKKGVRCQVLGAGFEVSGSRCWCSSWAVKKTGNENHYYQYTSKLSPMSPKTVTDSPNKTTNSRVRVNSCEFLDFVHSR
jgi:hypothetical protein